MTNRMLYDKRHFIDLIDETEKNIARFENAMKSPTMTRLMRRRIEKQISVSRSSLVIYKRELKNLKNNRK